MVSIDLGDRIVTKSIPVRWSDELQQWVNVEEVRFG